MKKQSVFLKRARLLFFFLLLSFAIHFALAQTQGNPQDSSGSISIQQNQGSISVNPFPAPPTSPVQTTETYGKNSPSILNESALGSANLSAVNPNKYEIEPGDFLSVELWTPQHLVVQGVVSPTGNLNIDPVGNIPVQGVILSKLSSIFNPSCCNTTKKSL